MSSRSNRLPIDFTVPMRSAPGIWLLVGMLAAAAVNGFAEQTAPTGENRQTLALIVDYGDGCEKHFPQLAWRSQMTVLDLLEIAAGHPHGIKIDYRGRGETAFLRQIDDLSNQGSGGRNWIFSVNGKLAGRGMGSTRLRAGDRVRWEFRLRDASSD